MANDPIAANAGRIVRTVVDGLHKLLSPPKVRPLALLPGDVLGAEDWELWQRSELLGVAPRASLSPEDAAHLKLLVDDVASAFVEALHAGTTTLYGVPTGGLERVEILPSALHERAHHRPRFDWPLNRILGRGGAVLFHGVVVAGKLPRVESLRSKLGRHHPGGRPQSPETLAAVEARRRWVDGGSVRGGLRHACTDVARERGLSAEAVYKAARR